MSLACGPRFAVLSKVRIIPQCWTEALSPKSSCKANSLFEKLPTWNISLEGRETVFALAEVLRVYSVKRFVDMIWNWDGSCDQLVMHHLMTRDSAD